MAELKYKPVPHDHETFLAKARQRKGFAEAYDSLELEYRLASQMIKARAVRGSLRMRLRSGWAPRRVRSRGWRGRASTHRPLRR